MKSSKHMRTLLTYVSREQKSAKNVFNPKTAETDETDESSLKINRKSQSHVIRLLSIAFKIL